ncbi:androgen-dependent TFPI-regulating protein-like [Cimex lectularius]|uniref:Androgen-dependent TFPI-regulating protein n=1 Tax=Cimex lectularius TaxID=79782 RepID=A0A8I6S2N6_CIMLE|nr:androgen-dependent TFPI-regulating protein-like [Cimex lectularius]
MDIKLFNRCLHTSVSVVNIITMISGLFLLASATMTKAHLFENQFLLHCWNCRGLYLSLWVTVVQHIYFGICSALDIIDVYSQKTQLLLKLQDYMNRIASYLLFTIVFPFSWSVFLLFWSVYFWDRNLIYPPIVEELFPPWINHVMHTLPVPLSVIYMMTSNSKGPSKISSLSGLVAFLAVYSYVFFSYYNNEGKWIYKALDMMTPTQLGWVFAFAALGPVCFLFLGYKLNETMDYCKRHSSLVMFS